MSSSVLDASVILALLLAEPTPILPDFSVGDTYLSTVNLAEVLSRLADIAQKDSSTTSHAFRLVTLSNILSLIDEIVPFTEVHATVAAELRDATRSAGLSLGDRACLALAIERGVDVYTADRSWATLTLPCRIHLIRY